ncbi:MAG: hypothetical protein ABL892_09140 [Thiobacillaceae bacterium]
MKKLILISSLILIGLSGCYVVPNRGQDDGYHSNRDHRDGGDERRDDRKDGRSGEYDDRDGHH